MNSNFEENKGFTFVEILSVLLIISILTAVAVSRATENNADLSRETEILKSRIRYVRYLAIANDSNLWEFRIPDDHSYELLRNNSLIHLPDIGEASCTLGTGIRISISFQGGSASRITFSSWGCPPGNSDYTVRLHDTGTGEEKSFIITKYTGFIQ